MQSGRMREFPAGWQVGPAKAGDSDGEGPLTLVIIGCKLAPGLIVTDIRPASQHDRPGHLSRGRERKMVPQWINTVAKNRLWLHTGLYLFIALIFFAKYTGRYGFSPLPPGIVYAVVLVTGTFMLTRGLVAYRKLTTRQYMLIVVVAGAGLLVFMYQFDPAIIRNARFNLLNQSLAALLNGSFPYGEPMAGHHSGFPFWFAVSLPFRLVGDVGLLQILGFFLGAYIFRRIDSSTSPAAIALLAMSPAFLYETAVRSGITTNMILLLVYLHMADKSLTRENNPPVFMIGLLGGLLLSTRGVAFLVFAVYLGFVWGKGLRLGLILLSGWIVSFCLTVLPFALWDWQGFLAFGPFAHQLRLVGLDSRLIALLVVLGFVLGKKLKTREAVLEAAGLFLFLGVFVSFGLSIFAKGLQASVWESHFDISYFCFPLPFIIVAWMLALKREMRSETQQVLE